MHLRAEYKIGAGLKFLGNLDMINLMERALRRAEIPYSLSEGYNPHIKLSMGTVLPVGVWGIREYFDLELKEIIDLNQFKKRINDVLPGEMQVNKCIEIPGNTSSLMKIINAADYTFLIKEKILDEDKLINEIMDKEHIIVKSKGKKKDVDKDIRPGIYHIHVEENDCITNLIIKVSINEPVNVRFDELLEVLNHTGIRTEFILDFYRRGNYIKDGQNFYTPLEKVK